nr:MAG TPA: YopX protein [Caudoviricetes sp.]
MREILFKAKRIDNGEWAEGYYTECNGKTFIGIDISIYSDIFEVFCTPVIRWFEVDPKTICQFTGLYDKNGKKIWESDIISYQRDNDDCPFPNKDTKKRFGKVFYQGFRSTFAIGMGKNGSRSINDDLWKYVQNGNRVEVIGNQFDNPELLQEES